MIKQPKKMIIIYILDILKKNTDSEHRLTQSEIQNILEKEYSLKVDRKSVKRNLMDLVEAGYCLDYDIITRINKKGEEEEIATNWYLENDFSDAELRLLIDSILFSKNIPQNQSRDLIKKLKNLSSKYFNADFKNVVQPSTENVSVKQIFYTLEIIDEAISKGKKIEFSYNYYGIDKQLYPTKGSDGKIRKYIVNPIQIVVANGRYYLIGNYDKYDDISHYRLDRITDVRGLETAAKKKSEIKGAERGLNLPKHMAEHVYMFSGESMSIKFIAPKNIVSEIIDWFGCDITITETGNDEIVVSLNCNGQAFRYWALQYTRFITVIYPQKLVNTIKEDLKTAYERYL